MGCLVRRGRSCAMFVVDVADGEGGGRRWEGALSDETQPPDGCRYNRRFRRREKSFITNVRVSTNDKVLVNSTVMTINEYFIHGCCLLHYIRENT